ncbi:MAG TPA: hypothetical protein VGG28_27970 [Kofleriaceae bacterium]
MHDFFAEIDQHWPSEIATLSIIGSAALMLQVDYERHERRRCIRDIRPDTWSEILDLPKYVANLHRVERDMLGVDETEIELPSWI